MPGALGRPAEKDKAQPYSLASCPVAREKACAYLGMTGDGSAVTRDGGPDRVTPASVLKNLESARVSQPRRPSTQLNTARQQRLDRPTSRAAALKWGGRGVWQPRVVTAVSARTPYPARCREASPLAPCMTSGPSHRIPGASTTPAVCGDGQTASTSLGVVERAWHAGSA